MLHIINIHSVILFFYLLSMLCCREVVSSTVKELKLLKEVTLHFNKCVYLNDDLKHMETFPPSPQ